MTSGSAIPGSPGAVPMELAVGLLLVGGVALGPSGRKDQGKVRSRPGGAHFSRI